MMNSKKLFFILLGVISLLVISGIGSVVYGNIFLKQQAEKIVALKVESLSLDEQQRSLIQAKKDIEKYSDLNSIARTIVPQDKDQAKTVRELVKLASESGVPLSNISFPASTLGDAPKKAPAGTEGTPAAPSNNNNKQTQVEPVTGISGVYEMEVNVQSSSNPIPYSNLLLFLKRLEQNRRTSQVKSLSVTPSTENRNLVTFSLIITVYIKP